MSPPLPWLVIITGPPAAGKTVLAKRLAEDLGLPLLTKDGFKETLFDSVCYGEDEWSHRLGGAAYDLLFHAAGSLLRAHRECIIEANFDIEGSLHSFECLQAETPYRALQIVCRARPETLVSRYRARHASGERNPGHHGDQLIDPVSLLRRHGPLSLDGPILLVDNETERSQAYALLVGRLLQMLNEERQD
jgi:predicted kinase